MRSDIRLSVGWHEEWILSAVNATGGRPQGACDYPSLTSQHGLKMT